MPDAIRPVLKIAFMGTPEFAAVALKALIESGHEVAVVYSQPPRPKGRGHKVQKSPVHILAEENNIPVYTPRSLKSADVQAEFAAHNVDVAVVAAYGLLLPETVLTAPRFGCINIHGSLLPKWRGAAPIQYAIWKGDDKSGVTIMQMDKGMDTGAMIAKGEVDITSTTTSGELHDKLAVLGAEMSLKVLGEFARNGVAFSKPQEDHLSTYASLLKKSDGQVDWSQSSSDIDRQIRALNPWPGVWTQNQGKRFKVLKVDISAEVLKETGLLPFGTVTGKDGVVICGKGTALKIVSIQPEGKNEMDFSSALNGSYLTVGSVFS